MPHISFTNKTDTKGTYIESNELSQQQRTKSLVQLTFRPSQQFQIAQVNESQKYVSIGNDSNYQSQQCLSYLQSSLFATILEDATTDMRILVECNNEMRVKKTMSDMAKLLVLKFQVSQPEVTDELEGIDPQNLENDVYKLKKLDNDRTLLLNIIIETYKNFIMKQNYNALEEHIKNTINLDKYRLELLEEETKNRIIRRELNKQLRQLRNHVKSVIYDTDAAIEELNIKVEDASLNSEIRSRYVDHWQIARTEQHRQTINDDESNPSSVIEYYKKRADSEQRVHTEVELLFNICINETLEKVENWMTKYDKDMEAIDLKIHIKKNDYQDMLDKRINYEEMIEKHDMMMKEWNHFKEEREKARLYREKMTNSAIMVQAWWRGLLVRRQLGPYRVAKKKGAGAKKK